MSRAWPGLLAVIAGGILCIVPPVLGKLSSLQQENLLGTRALEIEAMDPSRLQDSLDEALEWNRQLLLPGFPFDQKAYEDKLNLLGDGIMGILHVPAISVQLPIHHGSSPEVLARGVGHLERTALPCGSGSQRSVLSAHRGMAGALLFTRLDELQRGDLFWIENPLENLAYRVSEIKVIEPWQSEALDPVAGKDLVTLMTCTPYGINSHRLLVTGERTEWLRSERIPEPRPVRGSGLIPLTLPWICLGFIVTALIVRLVFRKEKNNDEKKN